MQCSVLLEASTAVQLSAPSQAPQPLLSTGQDKPRPLWHCSLPGSAQAPLSLDPTVPSTQNALPADSPDPWPLLASVTISCTVQ